MGVIKNEGIKQSIVTYIGVLIGAANTMYFYPKYFTEEELGLFRFLMDTALLIYPFVSLGITNLCIRMFPTFRNKENGHNGMLYFLIIGVLIGYGLFLLCFMFTYPFIDVWLSGKSDMIRDNWAYVVPLAGIVILASIFTLYILNFKKVLLPSIFNELFLKIGLPAIAVLIFFDVLSITEGIYVLIGVNAARLVALAIYVIYLKEWHWKPNWKFLTKPLLKEMGEYSFYGVLGSMGSIMATRIDILMIATLADDDLKAVGVYSIALFIANVIAVPSRAINNIASPVIAESLKNADEVEVKRIYSKSSLVLTTLGLFFLIGIWCSVDDLFALMPNGEQYEGGKYVILILGVGRLFDLATGTNHQIIAYSKFFKFNFYAVLILAILNVVNNFVFIPLYQINGAAIATAASLVIFNICKSVYVYMKMGHQPFSWETLKVFVIGALVYLFAMNISPTNIPLADIAIRSAAISVAFIGSVIYFNISEDLSYLFWQTLEKLKIYKR